MALALNAALPTKPLVEFVDANPNGFGLIAARKPRFVALLNCVLEYCAGSLADAPPRPEKYARNVGNGDVPAAPVYAKVAPRPAAMFACRFACALRNSCAKPLDWMLTSSILIVSQS